jgi:glutaredoxin-related protein
MSNPINDWIDNAVKTNDVVLFMKGTPTSRSAASPAASCRCWTTSVCRMPV